LSSVRHYTIVFGDLIAKKIKSDEVKIIGTGDIERRKNQSRTTSITVIVINIIAIVGIVPVGIIATVARF
jgi:hypothetical protein